MDLKLEDFNYDLPEDRIAKHPSKNRGESRLLFYKKGTISHHSFRNISGLLPENSLVIFNDTKVIPARIIMNKGSGARIEIFLLEPIAPSQVHEEVMNARKSCTWKCMIGNAKKWKIGTQLAIAELKLIATRAAGDVVIFHWETEQSFSDLLTEIGNIPLPPYINREVEVDDFDRYQTVYSKMSGAVAAPTAGLHFTPEILEEVKNHGSHIDFVTLHVSAGTFQPIKTEKIQDHPMHNEKIWISKKNIEGLINSDKTIAVGTTAMRTLESLYWYGVKILNGEESFRISKEDPYKFTPSETKKSLKAVLDLMDKNCLQRIGGETEIFIYPGYDFKICDGLITNYHQPGSTLILLIAAFVGDDWRKIYHEALTNNYQFLSYGDSSLLLR